ncbi:hypothetical protein WICPIJ_007902 [Wickerhamomyces pijperi]|uniref:Uncharacterized protein n=1 Tax=Wickerhamomyces pijperi TaxID=599730 RepID=A0A9P8PZN8_WICPI|nr:hypothetical protein WICPIJ_007902 [Wickerhamomyces pijperi]
MDFPNDISDFILVEESDFAEELLESFGALALDLDFDSELEGFMECSDLFLSESFFLSGLSTSWKLIICFFAKFKEVKEAWRDNKSLVVLLSVEAWKWSFNVLLFKAGNLGGAFGLDTVDRTDKSEPRSSLGVVASSSSSSSMTVSGVATLLPPTESFVTDLVLTLPELASLSVPLIFEMMNLNVFGHFLSKKGTAILLMNLSNFIGFVELELSSELEAVAPEDAVPSVRSLNPTGLLPRICPA